MSSTETGPPPAAPTAAGPRPLGPTVAGALVFLTSAAVLVLEIISLRLVAPYLGLTLEVSTAVIGFALAAIAMGAWIGGLAADRWPPKRMLGPAIMAGGALVLLVGPLVRATGEAVQGADQSAVLLIAAVAVFLPAALLSAVSPMIVKLQLGSLGEAGTVVGKLSGIGTAGALVGTFLTGFLLVSAVPTSRILLVLGGALIALGIALVGRVHLRAAAAGGTAAALVGVGAFTFAPQPCDVETAYHCASVIVDDSRPTGRTLQLDTLSHSYVDLADPEHLEFAYIRAMASAIDAVFPADEPVDALHIGGGAATLPRYLDASRPGSDSLVYEIDGGVVDLDRREFGLVTGEGIEVEIQDGRTGLADQGAGSRDVLIMDAFGGVAVPWHLTTRETVTDAARVLVPGGLYAANVIDYPPGDFARAEVATIAEVFDHVVLIARPPVLDGSGGGNLVIVASDAPLPVAAIRAQLRERGPELDLLAGADVTDFAGDAQILTDDFAPVDQLLTPAV